MMRYFAWILRVACSRRLRTLHSIAFLLLVGFVYIQYFPSRAPDTNGTYDAHATCRPQTQFAYIKMIKCASTTLHRVFQRFGLTRHLSVVLPLDKRIYIGWPYTPDDSLYRPSKSSDGRFDILCDHVIYNSTYFHQKLMSPNALYLTSIREPFSQFKSMVNYYNVLNLSQVPINIPDRFMEYIQNFELYEATYKSHDSAPKRYCIPDNFSMTRNLMSFNLGFPTGGFLSLTDDRAGDDSLISRWIGELDAEFTLILITEYFHESMVLLRRLMCWGLQDILFHATNSLKYDYKSVVDPHVKAMYQEWSRVDFALYDHFNKSLWNKIEQQGDDFWFEVDHFRRVNIDVNTFCQQQEQQQLDQSHAFFTVEQSRWNAEFRVTPSFCSLLSRELLADLQSDYVNTAPFNVSEKPPSHSTC